MRQFDQVLQARLFRAAALFQNLPTGRWSGTYINQYLFSQNNGDEGGKAGYQMSSVHGLSLRITVLY